MKDYIAKFDNAVLYIVSIKLKNTILDAVMPVVSWSNNYGQVYLLFVLISILNKKFDEWGMVIIFALILEVTICELFIKPLFKRARPQIVNLDNGVGLIKRPPSYSFPSGHTASSFAAAGVMWNMDSGYKYLILVIALLISFSRVYLSVHYPSDILGGIVLGLIVSKLTVCIYYEQSILLWLLIIFSFVTFGIIEKFMFKRGEQI